MQSPVLIVHISAGMVGLLSGTAAMLFRKGSRRHAVAGKTIATRRRSPLRIDLAFELSSPRRTFASACRAMQQS